MYVAFVSYKTRAVNGGWTEGFRCKDVDEGASTTEILLDILEKISQDLDIPPGDVHPVSFNVLPAKVGGSFIEELA